ncbi:hypothetical protein K0L52_001181, partial [Vibrio fluvialis]|nr:hypothetical protein [Vibrio fluvialis]
MIGNLHVDNLGPIDTADVSVKNLTIICGRNSVGKTYLSYTYYMLMQCLKREVSKSIKLPQSFNNELKDLGSETAVIRRNFQFSLEELNITQGSLNKAIKNASKDSTILKSLDLAEHCNGFRINASLNDSILGKIISSESEISLAGSIDITLSKVRDSDFIQIQIEKEDIKLVEEHDALRDVEFILKIFVTDFLLHLNIFPITSERT